MGLAVALLPILLSFVQARPAAAAGPCGPPVTSVIACENTLPGDPSSDWEVSGIGDSTIQGFATSMSVNAGQTESFKISTPATSYHIDILRLGYYQGNGARKVVSGMLPTASLPQSQPACLNDTAPTGLIDCGNWAVSASWTVPSDAVSGLYLAHLVRNDTGGGSLIPFVVRNDASHSDILYQTSDETEEAYNSYGGNSLYQCTVNCPPGNPVGYKGADKVSYNRPWHTPLDDAGRSWFLYAEYPMIRFMEANGYDVSYTSGYDVATRGALLQNHKVFISSGHDEYWSGDQRANVLAARNAGVNLAFFSGNEIFWKTRWEPSIDGSNTAGRTLVTYKETHYNAPTDPQDPPTWTGSWMDPRFSPPADGGQPQNALSGQLFAVNAGTTDITVPSTYSKLRFWRNTRVASLASGQSATLDAGAGTLGYEWDVDADNGFRPPGLMDMSSTTLATAQPFTDYGSVTTTQSTTHHLTLYRASSGALVFGAGTVQWAWGLDSANPSGQTDSAMQQATVNLFADMGAQPATLISGLTSATASTDTTPPTSTITSPSPGANLADGSALTVNGTATDAGGGVVAGVEVSTDGGVTWRPVTTMSTPNTSVTWSYSWVAHGNPTATIESRAVDDSGNLETPGSSATVNVNCPCSIWGNAVTPGGIDSGDGSSINVGVKFKTDVFGQATGVRFYKASTNTGTHVGSLWTSSGQLLASATFTGETASGWQQVNFAQPVLLNPNTTYIASYLAPKGHYSQDGGYFYTVPAANASADSVDSPPLHALRNSNGVTNGIYSYGSSTIFPTNTSNAENYWVDVAFSPSAPPGQVTNVTATAGYASAGLTWSAPASGGPVTTYTVTPYIGSAAQTPFTVTGSPAPTTATVTGLTNGTTYTFTVTASNPNGQGAVSTPSNAVTPSSSASLVLNGGFENGLAFWAPGGIDPPSASSAKAHSGSGSAQLGTLSGPEPLGDSNLAQTISVPAGGTSTLSFWYLPATADAICSGSGCTSDWQEAQIRNTAGQTLASVFKSNSNSQTWTQVTFNLTPYAGQNVVLWFNVHDDGSSPPDDTSMYLDDVSVSNSQPTAPGAPTAVTATAGNGSATVSWTAPSNGGSPITSYTVTPFVGSTAQTPVVVTGSPPATSATVTGLTNGTAYTFTVTATNAIGTGQASAPSNAVTPSPPAAPGAPTGVTATAGNGSAAVTWTAPGNGGSAITRYTITPYVAGVPQTPTTVTGSPPATSATVTGLTNGTSYTFTVSATNAIGTGPASAASNAVTPSNVVPPVFVQQVSTHTPSASTVAVTPSSALGSGDRLVVEVGVWSSGHATTSSVTDSAGDTFTEVSHFTGPDQTEQSVWTAPVTAGAGTKPVVTAKLSAAADAAVTALEYSGLSAAAGTGAVDQQASASGTTTTAGSVSSGPTAATGAGNELAVGFYSDSGFGDTLTAGSGYTARTNISGTGDMELLAEDQVVGSGATPAASAGTGARTVWEMATVVFKSGSQGAPAAPGAPTGVTATAGNGSATVSWTAPANGGSPITSYTVTPFIGSTAQTPVTVTGSPPATSTTVTGLTNGTAYTFTVTATNAIGTGPASAPSNPVTPAAPTVPGAPAGVTATAGNQSATVSWSAPANDGSPITSYTVTPYLAGVAQTATQVSGSPPATTANVTGLTNGSAYTFTVSATNAIGTGPASSPSQPVTPTAATTPAFVQQVSAHGLSKASLSVTMPANVTTGNRLVVEVADWSSGHATTASVTDSAGDIFTQVTTATGSDGTQLSVWTAPITQSGGTEPTIIAKPTANADMGIAVLEYSGLSTAAGIAAVDQVATATGTTTSARAVSSGSTPPTTAPNELSVGFYADSGFGDALTADPGYTKRVNVSPAGDIELFTEDTIVGQGAAPAPSVSTGAATVWEMATVVFKSGG
jgi:Domain of unknown function (DUF4082)/Fibronectin type III domain